MASVYLNGLLQIFRCWDDCGFAPNRSRCSSVMKTKNTCALCSGTPSASAVQHPYAFTFIKVPLRLKDSFVSYKQYEFK
jgi:hypothetical protein